MTQDLQKWSDRAMYAAQPIDSGGPKVVLLSCNSDPLGEIACATMTYEGKFPNSLSEVTDEQRRFYFDDVFKARRWAPLEFVNFHFLISGVTRAFTHQMVRQRTAVYAQESMRFAVKEDVPVGLPASIADTVPWATWWEKCGGELFPILTHEVNDAQRKLIDDYAEKQATPQQLWRKRWDECIDDVGDTYNSLVSAGMPAEDARSVLPTNLLTRIHYSTNLRNLFEHAGNRLCTQAQHEWKVVWREILSAIRDYPKDKPYGFEPVRYAVKSGSGMTVNQKPSGWQFDALAGVFKPICYSTGKCEFMSSADRYCAIRDRVQGFARLGIPSTEWGDDVPTAAGSGREGVRGIQSSEWMDNHAAARVSQ